MVFEAYHFHLYFERHQIPALRVLLDRLRSVENIKIGRVREEPVGPHPTGSCQITVKRDDFEQILALLLRERKGLDVFIHALSGDDLKDHTDYTMWLGRQYELNLSFFDSLA